MSRMAESDSTVQERPEEVGARRHAETMMNDLMDHVALMLKASGHTLVFCQIAVIPNGTATLASRAGTAEDASQELLRAIQDRTNLFFANNVSEHPKDGDPRAEEFKKSGLQERGGVSRDELAAIPTQGVM